MYNKTAYDYNIITAKTLKNINTPSLWLSYFADSNYNAILWLKFCWQKTRFLPATCCCVYKFVYISHQYAKSTWSDSEPLQNTMYGMVVWNLHFAVAYFLIALGMTLSMRGLCYWATSIFSDIAGASLVPKTLHGRRMLLELLFIRSGAFCLDSFSVSDVKVSIDGLRTC